MSDVVIRVENLCKEYRLGTINHGTLYRDIQSGWAKLRGIEDPNARIDAVNRDQLNNTHDRFSALKDVSFDVRQGEIVGIIGRNGAGKSTLLKIISRVTAPTSGTIKIKGRVASLLEVGTGFHPELTGRENIFLNGAILGMHKGEIKQKFDEIVKFAEIDQFIDTPVKRYSSGMYVRLAFAVAAHLEPEILIIDEVLAVGDAEFQKKCLGKMKDVSKTGRTILFVSHDMNAIRNLCQRTIWLKDGRIHQSGDVYEITSAYLRDSLRAKTLSDIPTLIAALPKDPAIKMYDIQIIQSDLPTNSILNGEPFEIIIKYSVFQRTIGLLIFFDLYDERGNLIIRTYHADGAEAIQIIEPGEYCSIITMPANILAHRDYEICIGAAIFNIRCCTGSPGEGIRIPIYVESSNIINKGYPENALQYRPMVQPIILWKTKLCEANGL